MDPPHQPQNPKFCKKHNQPVVLFDQQSNQSLCLICVQEKTGMLSINQIQQKQQEIKSQSDRVYQEEKYQLQTLFDSILKYKQNMINGIDKIIQIVIDKLKLIDQFKENFEKQLMKSIQLSTLNEVQVQLKNQEEHFKQFKITVKSLLSEFQQKNISVDNFNQILTNAPIRVENQLNISTGKQSFKFQQQGKIQQQRKFSYELVGEQGNKESNYCHAFAFSRDNSVVLVGCNSTIMIYEFQNGKIGKQLQVLANHKEFVYCLHSLQLSDYFISGSRDRTIIIWKYDINNQLVPQQILTDHQNGVNCLLMNKNEDLLFSGSDDETLRFWMKVNDQWCCYQTLKTDNSMYAMSLNEAENKLIACGGGPYVFVIEIKNDKQWNIFQKIQVIQCGNRLSFTFGDQFVYQPWTQDYLEVFDLDSKSNKFQKLSEVKIQVCQDCDILFPCLYVKSLSLLFIKHGQFLNILQINENKNYELIQIIQFEHQKYIYGTISNKGKHLITWDKGSEMIQVRTFELKNE